MNIILAKKVLPVTGPPINRGGICIAGDRIVGLGTARVLLGRYPGARVIDLGDALAMPGLVNAHTHLELSNLRGLACDYSGFFEWISRLIEQRRSHGNKDVENAAQKALKSAINSGTTCIGDISSTELAVPSIVKSGVRARIYLEVIGLDKTEAERAVRRLKKRMKSVAGLSETLSTGVSPHSTYSVSDLLYSMIRDNISDAGRYIAVHLSETSDEVRHIKGGSSGLDRYHSDLGWGPHEKNKAESPVGFLFDKGLERGLLAVHAVHVSQKDINRMASAGVSVAHCPRSNHMLGVGRAPVKRMIKAGVNVAIGTDSLASNMDLSMWEEMRFASLVNGLRAEEVIRMGTVNGARALGLEDVTGSLGPGKAADLIAVRGGAARAKEPYSPLLFETQSSDVVFAMVGGRVVFSADELKVKHGLL